MCYHQVLISSPPTYLASFPTRTFSFLFTKEDFGLDRLGRPMLKVSFSVLSPLFAPLSAVKVSQGVGLGLKPFLPSLLSQPCLSYCLPSCSVWMSILFSGLAGSTMTTVCDHIAARAGLWSLCHRGVFLQGQGFLVPWVTVILGSVCEL